MSESLGCTSIENVASESLELLPPSLLIETDSGDRNSIFTKPELSLSCEASSAREESPPFHLPRLERSPEDIVRQKRLTQEQRNQKESEILTAVDREIKMKLHFLGKIHQLQRRQEGALQESDSALMLGIKDRLRQLEQASRMAASLTERITVGQVEVGRENQEKERLLSMLETNRKVHQESVAWVQAKLRDSQIQVKQLRHQLKEVDVPSTGSPEGAKANMEAVSVATPGCLQFSDLFALSGHLGELCHGEYGSRFVIERLSQGAEVERSLVRTELGLPQSLSLHLASSHCREVILALARNDPEAKHLILTQAKQDMGDILAMDGGREFIEQLLQD